jgi:hypothetical protein
MAQIKLKLLPFEQDEKRRLSIATAEFINAGQALRNELYQIYYS